MVLFLLCCELPWNAKHLHSDVCRIRPSPRPNPASNPALTSPEKMRRSRNRVFPRLLDRFTKFLSAPPLRSGERGGFPPAVHGPRAGAEAPDGSPDGEHFRPAARRAKHLEEQENRLPAIQPHPLPTGVRGLADEASAIAIQ